MYQERFIGIFKERTGFLNSPTGVEQQVAFVGNMYDESKIFIGFQEVKYLFAKMVDVSSGATQQVSETAADDPKAAKTQCEGTQDCCGQACDSAACKAACGGKCDPANCDKADCKKVECPKQDCKNKK